jgi:hypothetical protein
MRGQMALEERRGPLVARPHASTHAPALFAVTEEQAAAIRTVFEERGELSAVIELRRSSLASETASRLGNACVSLPAGGPDS